jgi:hypothetical protein
MKDTQAHAARFLHPGSKLDELVHLDESRASAMGDDPTILPCQRATFVEESPAGGRIDGDLDQGRRAAPDAVEVCRCALRQLEPEFGMTGGSVQAAELPGVGTRLREIDARRYRLERALTPRQVHKAGTEYDESEEAQNPPGPFGLVQGLSPSRTPRRKPEYRAEWNGI